MDTFVTVLAPVTLESMSLKSTTNTAMAVIPVEFTFSSLMDAIVRKVATGLSYLAQTGPTDSADTGKVFVAGQPAS